MGIFLNKVSYATCKSYRIAPFPLQKIPAHCIVTLIKHEAKEKYEYINTAKGSSLSEEIVDNGFAVLSFCYKDVTSGRPALLQLGRLAELHEISQEAYVTDAGCFLQEHNQLTLAITGSSGIM